VRVHISAKWILQTLPFPKKKLRGHVQTVPGNMHVKFEVRSFIIIIIIIIIWFKHTLCHSLWQWRIASVGESRVTVGRHNRTNALTALNWSDWPVRCAQTDRHTHIEWTHYLYHSLRSLGRDEMLHQGANYKKILRLSYDVIITYDNRKWNLR